MRDGEHVLIVHSAQEFAQKIIHLLQHGELRQSLAEKARTVIEREYSWKKIVGDLNPDLDALAQSQAESKPVLVSGQ